MSVKTLREDLCRHQSRRDLPDQIASGVDVLIAMIDKHRPLGVDGKHGDLHTATCGCTDQPIDDCPEPSCVDGVIHDQGDVYPCGSEAHDE